MALVPTSVQLQNARIMLRSQQSSVLANGVSSSQATYEITLRFMDGSDLPFHVSPNDRAHALKSQVATQCEVTEARVRLAFDAAILNRDDILSEVGVLPDVVVDVIIVPPLHQGSQVYSKLAQAYARSTANDNFYSTDYSTEVREEVHDALEDMMDKKAIMNDAFVKAFRARRHGA